MNLTIQDLGALGELLGSVAVQPGQAPPTTAAPVALSAPVWVATPPPAPTRSLGPHDGRPDNPAASD